MMPGFSLGLLAVWLKRGFGLFILIELSSNITRFIY